jgi:hypothetical protein
MPHFFPTVSEITVPTASSWQSISLSSYFGAQDSPAGLLFMVTNKSTSASYSFGLRCTGSTETYLFKIGVNRRVFLPVGISSGKSVDLYSGNLTNLDFHLVGWFDTTEAYFPVTRHYTSVADSGTSYVDVDPSSIIQGSDVPKVYLGAAYRATDQAFDMASFRPNGSTDTWYTGVTYGTVFGFAISTNDELFEVRNDATGQTAVAIRVLVTGYLRQSAKLVTVLNWQVLVGSIVNQDAWATVPNTLQLNGVLIEDALSYISVWNAYPYAPTFGFALAGSSSDTPLADIYQPMNMIGYGFGSMLSGISLCPLARSRVSGKTQSLYFYDSGATAAGEINTYVGWKKAGGSLFGLGGLF